MSTEQHTASRRVIWGLWFLAWLIWMQFVDHYWHGHRLITWLGVGLAAGVAVWLAVRFLAFVGKAFAEGFADGYRRGPSRPSGSSKQHSTTPTP